MKTRVGLVLSRKLKPSVGSSLLPLKAKAQRTLFIWQGTWGKGGAEAGAGRGLQASGPAGLTCPAAQPGRQHPLQLYGCPIRGQSGPGHPFPTPTSLCPPVSAPEPQRPGGSGLMATRRTVGPPPAWPSLVCGGDGVGGVVGVMAQAGAKGRGTPNQTDASLPPIRALVPAQIACLQ